MRPDIETIELNAELRADGIMRSPPYEHTNPTARRIWQISNELRYSLTARTYTRPNTEFVQNVAARVAAARLPVCLLPRSDSVSAVETFRFDVARLIREGLPEDAALKGVTITPATILGVDWRIGSLEEGKDADILLLDGDIFDPSTHITRIFIAGECVFTREAAK